MKRISLIVLLSMLLTLIAACGNAGTGSDTTGAPSAAAGSPVAGSAAPSSAASSAPNELTSPVASAAASTAAGGALPDLGGKTVRIGTDATYPPFESVEEGGTNIVGFDVDLMNEVGKLINIKPQFENAKFDTIFTALQSGQFDAVMSAATITDERKKIVAFTDPYIEVGQLVVTKADNTALNSYQDLSKASAVGVQTGTTGETAALETAKVPDGNLRRYDTIDLAFADLANGTIDAVVADGPTVGNYTSQDRYKTTLKLVGEPFTTESYGIAVQQSNTELVNAINAALAQLKQAGTIDQLKEKYQIK